MKAKTLVCSIFLFFVGNIWAQSLSKILYDFRHHASMKHALVAYHIIELGTGKTMASRNATVMMSPASTLKTLYVFSALDDYGMDFSFRTDLYYHGHVKFDTLHGDLILRSGGDPTFGSPVTDETPNEIFNQIIQKLQRAGIRTVMGKIILQVNGNFYPAPGSWPLEDIGNYYGAGYWGFNFADNTIYVYLKNHPVAGKQVKVDHTEPQMYKLRFLSHVYTAPPGTADNAYIFADPLCYERHIFGTIPAGDSLFVIKGALPDPPRFFIHELKNHLLQAGITINGPARVETRIKKYPNEKLIWGKISKSLHEIGQFTLDHSVNLYSEALARLLVEKGVPAHGYMSKDSINAYFRSKGFRFIDLEDGSGLAPDNMIAPVEFTRFFYRLSQKHGIAYLKDILPHAGQDGYAKSVMRGMTYQSHVWIKSGSVSKVQNYVGIFKGRSGKYYAFALMVNHFTAQRKTIQKQMHLLLNRMIRVL